MAAVRAKPRNVTIGAGRGKNKSRGVSVSDLNRFLLQLAVLAGTFYGGVLVGMHTGASGCGQQAAAGPASNTGGLRFGDSSRAESAASSRGGMSEDQIESIVQERLQKELLKRNQKKGEEKQPRLSSNTGSFAKGIVRTSAEDLVKLHDYGTASMHREMRDAGEALILYSKKALPDDALIADAAQNSDGDSPPLVSAADATASCDVLNVVTVNSRQTAMCTAILSDYESYHVSRWMRIQEKFPKRRSKEHIIDRKLPLRHISRGVQANGVDQFAAPREQHMKDNMESLKKYLNSLDGVMAELEPIVKKVAKKNTVIVLVCNKGQSDLLMNFACSAKTRNLDTSMVLVFATDQHTYDVATGLGLTSFFDKENFGSMPEREAKQYGDKVFTQMMFAKVVPVQLINMMGYDVLFQDVDVVWYQNPVDVFHNKASKLNDFDILFQDDGARNVRFAPYSGNTGFYYVRHNQRTRFLLNQLLFNGDIIKESNSHQQALTALLSEHSSLTGLRVKTLDGEDFPSGFHYHRAKDLMRKIVKGKHEPYLFHMCWTANKDNKILFLKQMGLWYINEQCTGSEALDTVHEHGSITSCCSAEPLVSCHYRDKPSVIPCKDSPPIDPGHPSFW